MNHKSPRQLEDEQRLAERAAEWVVTLPQASAAERTEFVQWVRSSPQHLQEFLLASEVVHGLGRIDLESIPGWGERMAADSAIVVHMPASPEGAAQVPAARTRNQTPWRLAAGLAVLAVTAAAAWSGWTYWNTGSRTYVTAVGEQRTIQLNDGSTIQLNVDSRVQVRITDEVRRFELLEGEALFKVRQDPTRPFRVHAAGTVIQALGTQFNVRRQPSGTTVSVLEGLVRVSGEAPVRPSEQTTDTAAPPAATQLGAGEEVRVGLDGRIERRAAVDIATVATWRSSRLDFKAERLTDIATEFNRYNQTPRIEVLDEEVGARRYSGVFDAHDPRALADFLREDQGLVVEERRQTIVVGKH